MIVYVWFVLDVVILASKYVMHGHLSNKADVYSFGVLLLDE